MSPRRRQDVEPRPVLVLGAITAAGDSRRMGRPKALLPWGETTFLAVMAAALSSAGLEEAPAVVVGADRDEVLREVRRVDAVALENRDYRSGRFSSVRTAASWALERGRQEGRRVSLLLWPVDCPAVAVPTLVALIGEAIHHPERNVVPSCEGRRGHPVVLCERLLHRIVAEPVDPVDPVEPAGTNLRDLLADAGIERRIVAVEDPAILDNLNDPEQYAEFLRLRAPAREGSGIDG